MEKEDVMGRKPKMGGKEKTWKRGMEETQKGAKQAARESEPNKRRQSQ